MTRFALYLLVLSCFVLFAHSSSPTPLVDVEVQELEEEPKHTAPAFETPEDPTEETVPQTPKGHPTSKPSAEKDSKCPVMNSYRFAKRKIVPAVVSAVQALPMPEVVKAAFSFITQAFSLPAPASDAPIQPTEVAADTQLTGISGASLVDSEAERPLLETQ
eukprot:GDKI01037591.1.p1 GENE.GDKI01037591.1~~GDKI01037591.1.p1  ORF type:complete len:161 (+),score=27.43 GDKI01037591.1:78-560(+)